MSPVASPFEARDRRAAELTTQHSHAAELLMLYRVVLAYQEPVYDWVRGARWRQALQPAAGSTALPLVELPFRKLERRFRRFAGDLAPNGTEVLTAAGTVVERATSDERSQLLRLTVADGELDRIATALETEPALLVFYARAFLQPIVEALAAEAGELPAASTATHSCPRCGWPPQVAILRDEAHLTSGRFLICSLCATPWPAPRLACAACGESDTDRLRCHEDESRPHLRLDECLTCKAYLKTIDLRQDATAVPLVDDIATVELDLWATERGLEKICPNLLGQ